MPNNNSTNIRSNAFDDLQKSFRLRELTTREEFQEALNLEKAIIYFLVNWSAQERISRALVYHVLNDLDNNGTPVFQIDISDQKKEYIEDWLIEQQNLEQDFKFGGYGETLLVSKGVIIDFINNPGQLDLEKLKSKMINWK